MNKPIKNLHEKVFVLAFMLNFSFNLNIIIKLFFICIYKRNLEGIINFLNIKYEN